MLIYFNIHGFIFICKSYRIVDSLRCCDFLKGKEIKLFFLFNINFLQCYVYFIYLLCNKAFHFSISHEFNLIFSLCPTYNELSIIFWNIIHCKVTMSNWDKDKCWEERKHSLMTTGHKKYVFLCLLPTLKMIIGILGSKYKYLQNSRELEATYL